MLKAVFLVAFAMFTCISCHPEKRIVCYHGSWAGGWPGMGPTDVSHINPHLCTHLVYASAGLEVDGGIKILNPWADLTIGSGKGGYEKFNGLRHWHPHTKTMISIGGCYEGSSKYSKIAESPHTRGKFVHNVVKFLRKHKFDGVDVDWQYPNQHGGRECDKDNYVILLKELRQAFDRHGYILSIAAAAAEETAALSYHIAEVLKHVHFVNLKSYDYNGAWNKHAGSHSPLYASSKETGIAAKLNVDASIKYWLSHGAPAHKINVGIPSYGRTFTLEDATKNEIGSSCSGPGKAGPYTRRAGHLGYNEICSDLGKGGWTVVRDEDQHVPYAYKDNQWVGYDDPTSVKEKAKYINSLGLGGAMLWNLENDDFHGNCGEKYPLLKALNEELRGGLIKWW